MNPGAFLRGVGFFLAVMVVSSLYSYTFFVLYRQIHSQTVVERAIAFHREFSLQLWRREMQQSMRVTSRVVTPIPTPSLFQMAVTPFPTSTPTPTPTPMPKVTENELWRGLGEYRKSHQRTELIREESLCVYARERVAELLKRLEGLSSEDSPLDGHAGFERDAASGKVFKDTGFIAVAENLAYLPAFATATQIVEWGWDSSSSHRNAQLSNDWTHGCMVGTYPIYVGLFGRR